MSGLSGKKRSGWSVRLISPKMSLRLAVGPYSKNVAVKQEKRWKKKSQKKKVLWKQQTIDSSEHGQSYWLSKRCIDVRIGSCLTKYCVISKRRRSGRSSVWSSWWDVLRVIQPHGRAVNAVSWPNTHNDSYLVMCRHLSSRSLWHALKTEQV